MLLFIKNRIPINCPAQRIGGTKIILIFLVKSYFTNLERYFVIYQNVYLIMVNEQFITTSNLLEGYRIVQHLGTVRGITVRSRSIFGNIAGGFISLVGGRNSIYVQL